MNTFLKIIKRILIGILTICIVFFSGTFIYNIVATKSDAKKILDYGQKVEVFGKKINIVTAGNGKETIVMLTGYGTNAPAHDFQPMIDELAPYYKIIVIEPFGYGLSDETNRERTNANIVEEIHEVLQKMHVSKFIYMGHSIAGIYGLNYANTYPEEMQAFIGIDTSVPEQPGVDLPIGLLKFINKSGLLRFSSLFSKTPTDPVAAAHAKQLQMLSNRNALSDTKLNEAQHITENFTTSIGMKFPKEMPVYLFVQKTNTGVEHWTEMHKQQIEGLDHGKMLLVDGDHYLHHTEAKIMANETRNFLAVNKL